MPRRISIGGGVHRADRDLAMQDRQVVEQAAAAPILTAPRQGSTKGLLASVLRRYRAQVAGSAAGG